MSQGLHGNIHKPVLRLLENFPCNLRVMCVKYLTLGVKHQKIVLSQGLKPMA